MGNIAVSYSLCWLEISCINTYKEENLSDSALPLEKWEIICCTEKGDLHSTI